MKDKCLYCYKTLSEEDLATEAGKAGYHSKCCKTFYGSEVPPVLDFTEEQMLSLAKQVLRSQKTVTGVQPKLSLGFSKSSASSSTRFTIVGLWGEYILKPQTEAYAHLPENEDLTMHLAALSKLNTVEHTLIKLKSGQLAYLTKRIDRKGGVKLHMEDMCQLTERLTEHKYKGSYEQIAKVLKQHSINPGLDLVDFYELVLFSFLTGNNDMHLKNFSLLKRTSGYTLCPAYDLLATSLVVEDDDEDLALNLNGKKKKITRSDFEKAMQTSGLSAKVIDNIFKKYQKLYPKWMAFIDNSFLPKDRAEAYKELVLLKVRQVELL